MAQAQPEARLGGQAVCHVSSNSTETIKVQVTVTIRGRGGRGAGLAGQPAMSVQ